MKNFRVAIGFINNGSVEFEELDNTRSFKRLKNMLRAFVLILGLMESL